MNRTTNYNEIYRISSRMYPFGDENVVWEETYLRDSPLQRNLVKVFKENSCFNENVEIKVLLEYFPLKNRGFYSDFNQNYSFLLFLSIFRVWETFKRPEEVSLLREYGDLVYNWVDSLFITQDNQPEIVKTLQKSLFFKFDLVKDAQLEFLLKNLLKSSLLSLIYDKKHLKFLFDMIKTLFYKMISFNFTDSLSKLGFFPLKAFSFKKSFIYKGFILEIASKIHNFKLFTKEKEESRILIKGIRLCLCNQEFFEAKQGENPLKSGFDSSFFTPTLEESPIINKKLGLNCIIFQRKVPENVLFGLISIDLVVIEGIGEKIMKKLIDFLGIFPLNNIYFLKEGEYDRKYIKEIEDIEIFRLENRVFLMFPEEEGNFYNIMFFLQRESFEKGVLFEGIKGILQIMYEALCEEEFLIEKGSFECVFLMFLAFNTRNSLEEYIRKNDKKKVYGYLKGFFCFVKGIKNVLEGYSQGKDINNKVFGRFFSNKEYYLKDYNLFLNDCEFIFEKEGLLKFLELFEKENRLKREMLNEKNLILNKKKEKYKGLKQVFFSLTDFPFLKFI